MPMATADMNVTQPKRLVLCFDGTAKKFAGDQSDSNVVKIYQMLDRAAEDQFHYYQPGIGTYIQGDSSYGFWHSVHSFFAMGLDQAFGLSFQHHVVAGYQFIMRYYSPGDHIYIIGFSRGAYTARFLAEMLGKVGLLSRGNEEMVQFAWKTFSEYQTSRGSQTKTEKNKKDEKYMDDFRKTFCRNNVSVYFLGLFDCVNSVGQFDLPFTSSSYEHIPAKPAKHIRHAVSINERRIKFKPALFHQQIYDEGAEDGSSLKEVWFAGAHGDVGGGWPRRAGEETRTLSTLSLKWMIEEIIHLPNESGKLRFGTEDEWAGLRETGAKVVDIVKDTSIADRPRHDLDRFVLLPDNEPPKFPKPHDELTFGRASSGLASTVGTLFWRFIEYVPLFSRLVFKKDPGIWVSKTWPPNQGRMRDMPKEAEIHPSVKLLHEAGVLSESELPDHLKSSHRAHVAPSKGLKGL